MPTLLHEGSIAIPRDGRLLSAKQWGTMKTVSIISQKGGAGKTTLAINLAGAAVEQGLSVIIIDLDPQTSAKKWHDDRENKEAPAVISAHAERLAEILAAARANGADLCIIDTAPHSETNALDAATAADLVLIPCRASSFDLKAITTSIKLTKIAQKPAVIVINGAQPRGSLANQAEQGITEKYGMPVLETRVTQRAAFVHSATEGKTVFEYEPGGAAAAEIKALFASTCRYVGMPA